MIHDPFLSFIASIVQNLKEKVEKKEKKRNELMAR